nr:hypothetical protein JVH1_3540 [Rhodococcus sp. JVH1]
MAVTSMRARARRRLARKRMVVARMRTDSPSGVVSRGFLTVNGAATMRT